MFAVEKLMPLFPASAGVILKPIASRVNGWSVPRERGGDPR